MYKNHHTLFFPELDAEIRSAVSYSESMLSATGARWDVATVSVDFYSFCEP